MKRTCQAAMVLLLVSTADGVRADDDDAVDAETTIRLMDAAEASSSFAVTGEITLPDNARIDPPARGNSGSAKNGKERENQGQRNQRDERERGRGRSRADEARDNARDMSDDARENRENRGRSDDAPGRRDRPGRPDRPDPPKGPPGT